MRLIDTRTGREIRPGDEVISFRGEHMKVVAVEKPHHVGSTGRIHTNKGVFFPSVFDCAWRADAPQEEQK